jgi:hypothetical protein
MRDQRFAATAVKAARERQREMTNSILVLLILVLLFGALGLFVTKAFLIGLAAVAVLALLGRRRLNRA